MAAMTPTPARTRAGNSAVTTETLLARACVSSTRTTPEARGGRPEASLPPRLGAPEGADAASREAGSKISAAHAADHRDRGRPGAPARAPPALPHRADPDANAPFRGGMAEHRSGGAV